MQDGNLLLGLLAALVDGDSLYRRASGDLHFLTSSGGLGSFGISQSAWTERQRHPCPKCAILCAPIGSTGQGAR